MKKAFVLALLLAFGVAVLPAMAATKTYQVTGPVLEVRPDAIVVQKGSDKWEIARDASTKLPADVKVGIESHDHLQDDGDRRGSEAGDREDTSQGARQEEPSRSKSPRATAAAGAVAVRVSQRSHQHTDKRL